MNKSDITRNAYMILINYESPNGHKRHTRLWNGGTGQATVKLYQRRHGRYRLIDQSPRQPRRLRVWGV